MFWKAKIASLFLKKTYPNNIRRFHPTPNTFLNTFFQKQVWSRTHPWNIQNQPIPPKNHSFLPALAPPAVQSTVALEPTWKPRKCPKAPLGRTQFMRATVDGSEIRRSPVEVGRFIPLFPGFYTPSQVVVWEFWTINSMKICRGTTQWQPNKYTLYCIYIEISPWNKIHWKVQGYPLSPPCGSQWISFTLVPKNRCWEDHAMTCMWSITMVIASPLSEVRLAINGL